MNQTIRVGLVFFIHSNQDCYGVGKVHQGADLVPLLGLFIKEKRGFSGADFCFAGV